MAETTSSEWPHGNQMADRIRAHDWAATYVGPLESWPQSLKTAVDIMLGSGHAMQLAWGPERTVLYNDAYAPMLGDRHPTALGLPFREAWPDIWEEIEPLVTRVFAGETVRFEDMPLVMTRNGYPEDTWWNFSYSPVRDEAGAVAGLLNVTVDATPKVRADRAEQALRDSEARQMFLLKLSDALRPLADAAEIQSTTTQLLATHLSVDRSMYAEVEGEVGAETGTIRGQYVRPAHEGNASAAPFPKRFTFDVFGAHRMTARYRGDLLVVEDVEADPTADPSERAAWGAAKVRAAVVAPLVKGGRLVAEFGVHCEAPRAWTEAELSLIREVAERTWAAAERARAEDALRDSEERFRTFVVASSDVVYRMSPDWSEMRELTGQGFMADTSEPNPRWIEHYIHPGDHAAVQAAIDRAIAGRSMFELQHRVVRVDGTLGWTHSRAVPILGKRGEIVEWLGAARDITAQRETEERYRMLFEAVDEGFCIVEVLFDAEGDPTDYRFLEVNPAFERQTGLVGATGRSMRALAPSHEQFWFDIYGRIAKTGESARFEHRAEALGRWYDVFAFRTGAAEQHRVAILFRDIRARKEAEVALRESETRLQTLIEGVPQLVWGAKGGGEWTWASPQWTEFTGQAQVDSRGFGWLDVVHPDDRERARESWEGATDRGEFQADYRLCHAGQDRYRWFQTRATPVRDENGQIVEWLGTSTDVDDLVELQDRQQVLVAELQHRTRNLMGVVRSMADRTIATSQGLPDFRARFRDRLAALARVQGLLSRLEEHDRVTFDELIRTELTALDGEADNVTLEGPTGVRLRSSMVQTLAMALHELATNAVKYGALKQPDGRLAIRWSVTPPDKRGRPWLHIDWRESGVDMPPAGAAPQGAGQGRELIEQALPYQLSAETNFAFEEDGVHCTIALPVSASNPALDEQHA